MDNKQIKSDIRRFNKTKDVKIYSNLLDICEPNRRKCKCCGGEIIFPHTKIHYSDTKGIYATDGCYNTTKTVNNINYHLNICWNCLSERYPDIKNPARCFNVMSEITAYAFDIPKEEFNDFRTKYAMTESHMVEKYGEEEGKKKWDDYCKRQSETNTFEYKQKVYGWTKEDFDDYNQSRAVTLNNMVKRYGEKEGKKKWDDYCKRQSETKSWDYMVEKYGENKAREIIKQRMTGINDSGYSNISQELFKKLDKYLCPKYTTYYASKNYEVEKSYMNLTYKLDYFIAEKNICVEFNGSIFHADPRLFEDSDHPNPFNKNLTAKEIREHDNFRYEILEKYFGIKTIVVWEADYNSLDIDDLIKKIENL